MKLLILCLLSCLAASQAYKILCLFPIPSGSHNILGKGVVRSLLKAGHEVTWVTPYESNKPQQNLSIIYIPEVAKLVEGINMTSKSQQSFAFIRAFTGNITRLTAVNKDVQNVLISQQFDAVVTEWFLSNTDAGYAAIQKVPWIVLFGSHMQAHLEYLIDEVRSVSTIPSISTELPFPMNFWQRLVNFGTFVAFQGIMAYDCSSTRYEEYFAPIAKARGVELAPYEEAMFNISVLFVNSHPSIAPAQSVPPSVVNVAGYHIDDGAPLPKDLQDLLDKSTQGVIYFSLGSVVKTSALPKETIDQLLKFFGSLKYTVLWKLDTVPDGVPKNVLVRSWWPQASILAHPNIRLFITHGGLLSTIEAVHYGVQLLATPVFADQPMNAKRAEQAGYARVVPFDPGFAPELISALKEMLSTDRYVKRVKYLSQLFNKRPTHPSNLISHYIEVAIESKGAYHLRSATYLYKWYERWMLDQLVFFLVILYVLKLIVVKTVKLVFGKKKEVQKKDKKVKRN